MALYARVSKDDGSQDAENQLLELREFCRRSGWTIEHEYVDRVTGGKSDRPQFKKLFADASKKKFDLVLFWALDRFSREGVGETLNHLQRLSGWGVNWRSYQEPFFDSCGFLKDAIVAIMAALAKQERIKISDRTKAGLKRARRAGKQLGRPRLPAETEVEIAELHKRGMSLRTIAAQLGIGVSSVTRVLGRTEVA